jgi:predicted transcriptional regulator
MLSARVSTAIARQFRSLAKLRGQKVQGMMETALSEYLERNRF